MSFFDDLIGRVLTHEGGYVNDPKDPGGETQWGISKRSYPNVDIAALTRPEAIEIYRTDFWQRVHGDEMDKCVAYLALDFAVNSGIETAIRKLQAAAGVADDGHWGPITRDAVGNRDNAGALAMRYVAQRMRFQRKLSTWSSFSGGWTERNARNLEYAAEDLE